MYNPRLEDTHALIYETETERDWIIVITSEHEVAPESVVVEYKDGTARQFVWDEEMTEKVRMRIRVSQRSQTDE